MAEWIDIMVATAPPDGGEVSDPRVVVRAEGVDWAAHVSAALYHMEQVKTRHVAMVDEAALQRICSYLEAHLEVLMHSTDRHLLRLVAYVVEMLDASMDYRPHELFRRDDVNKLRPVEHTHCSPENWRETLAKQAMQRRHEEE